MADKTITLTAEQSEKLAALGFSLQDFITLVLTKGPAAFALLKQLFDLFSTQAKAQRLPALAENCCDHKACCEAVLASALQTAMLAAEHCCQCCEEAE